ncbi:MAG: hypothetical protein ACI4PP_05710 [Clostridia bacterium]
MACDEAAFTTGTTFAVAAAAPANKNPKIPVFRLSVSGGKAGIFFLFRKFSGRS